MNSFTKNFVLLYSKYDPTSMNWTINQVREKLIELINNNEVENPKIKKKYQASENDIDLIANALLSESFSEK